MENIKNSDNNKGTLTGVFNSKDSAENAYNNLLNQGYKPNEISVLMSEETRNVHFKNEENNTELGSKAMESAGVGSAIGGTAGAIIGAIAAIGTSVAIPGLGLIIAGPIVAGLTGAGAGGLTGGLIGALMGSGVPEEHAKRYEDRIKEGNIVLGVTPRSAEEGSTIANDWKNYSGQDIYGADLYEEEFERRNLKRDLESSTKNTEKENKESFENSSFDNGNKDAVIEENIEDSDAYRDNQGLEGSFDNERLASEGKDDNLAWEESQKEKNEKYNASRNLGMSDNDDNSNLNLKGHWNEVKGKLMQRYAYLTNEDLTYTEGREDELLGKLEAKTGKSKSELRREIKQY